MSLKAELETWAAALQAYDEEDFDKSLELFSRIADSSKILTNIGLIYATIGEHEVAVERFIEATNLDQYLAVAYFQCGVSNFLLTRYEMALRDFEEAYLYLRGNQDINYEQLGLKFRLYSAEVLFNKGLAKVYLGRGQEGIEDMEGARRDKATEEHNVIDDAIQDRGEGYTVFSIPVGVLYRPSEKKIKNAVTKDYMGKAKLVAASDPGDAYTEFTGATRLKQGISPSGVYIDRPNIDSGGSTNLVRSASISRMESSRFAALERSKTALNISTNTDESSSRLRPSRSSSRRPSDPMAISPQKNTAVDRSPAVGNPVRGLNVKRPGTSPLSPSGPASSARSGRGPVNRVTEFYDDYLASYSEQSPVSPPLRNGGQVPLDRVAFWARANAESNFATSRLGSQSAPPSNYAPSFVGGRTIRRKSTRRTARSNTIQSKYEEEEGYASGDYDDAYLEIIRIKIHYEDDVRGMTLQPDTPFEDFMRKLAFKFNKDVNTLALKFTDEDGVKVTLKDESDFELAVETARSTAKGKAEGKLEIWCTN